jgi:hypothetical protein
MHKNKALMDTVPNSIAIQQVKDQYLQTRKNIMVRLIHSELRSKKTSEWTVSKLLKQKQDAEIMQRKRP